MSESTRKVAVVTGAQQGIGRAAALALAETGVSVIVNYLDDPDAAKEIAAEAESRGVAATAVQGDISQREDVEALLAAADALGGIDILVNNAAIFPRSPVLEMTMEEWDAVIGANLRGSFLCAQAAAKRMVAAGRPGGIVSVTSRSAFTPSPRGVHYAASKAGLIGMTRALALELAPHGIRVNAVAPGLTDTAQPRYGMTEQQIAAAVDESPISGITKPEDIAQTIVFLSSDAASRITGQTVHVNGGQFLY
ncbi:MAG: SDR family NAD(P)-dependent oxidoreductase [Rhodospirillaceae bacterium]|nr:SDR family NAD(P)-dependent oxidoreductase [Rhodospirillaceae bacterium]MDD9916447.1 SDR family NAD(P)-dependent oxidoreductase [Rhodospirillaceae bacterium]MDD9924924.1 SDR family NAD(P)-dependent oxidoreductase [Rhodospirillaceae bacterium]